MLIGKYFKYINQQHLTKRTFTYLGNKMNKFLATLLAGAFTLTLGSAAFAADVSTTAEPAKVEATTPAADAKAAPAKTMKKHHQKHVKKVVKAPAAK